MSQGQPQSETLNPDYAISRLAGAGAFCGAIYGYWIGNWFFWSWKPHDSGLLVGVSIGVIGATALGYLLRWASKAAFTTPATALFLGAGFGLLWLVVASYHLFKLGTHLGLSEEVWMYLALIGGGSAGGAIGVLLLRLRNRYRVWSDIATGTVVMAIAALILIARFGN
jgi:hypothetical protein